MLKIKVVGAGAAGNKAAINLIKKGFIRDDVTLINSTSRDIEEEFKSNSIIFGAATLGGCGKERVIGKKLILSDLKAGSINLDGIADGDTNLIIIVSSTEGGSGSAAAPILAKYFKEVIGIPVLVCLFFGFGNDTRGLQNSIEVMQEMPENVAVLGISNESFLTQSNGNKLKAEQAANDEFAEIVRVISGSEIVPGSQNIDDTDLLKLVTTTGYMKIETANISKIKNLETFNKAVLAATDESHLISTSKGCSRMGMIFDIEKDIEDYIDVSGVQLRNVYGEPFEAYTHVQYGGHNTVTWIVSGLPLPLKEVQEIYDRYIKSSGTVNKSKDTFFDALSEMKGNSEDGQFDMLSSSANSNKGKSKASFFSDFGISSK